MTLAILLAAATAAADAPDLTICADRPSKANGVCTVPAGHWQVEISAGDWARTNADGARTDVTSLGQTFLKLGLSDDSDGDRRRTRRLSVYARYGVGHERSDGARPHQPCRVDSALERASEPPNARARHGAA